MPRRTRWIENAWILRADTGNIIRCDIYRILEDDHLEVRVENGNVGLVSSVVFEGIYGARACAERLRSAMMSSEPLEDLSAVYGLSRGTTGKDRR